MRRYRFIVFSRAVRGREAEYNDWYQNVHLADVVAIEGFTSAQRFCLASTVIGEQGFPYLAIYEIETDDVAAVVARLYSRIGTDAMVISEALDLNASALVYEEMGPSVQVAPQNQRS
jgi:hypothetical protein